ncbi:MFS transporter [Frankia tisae]|uniref:MFS transporter n=1 Tax=Frankia tisae TaxID=2950104 RepID=UPI0021C18355|nr:MFS transporter [Frankia tisae]
MYLAGRGPLPESARGRTNDADGGGGEVVADADAGAATPAMSANVLYLGLTSLVTDVSAEMVASVLPLYLTARLGFSALQFGAADGFLQVVAAVIALLGALLADRWRRYREAAGAGYALSAASRLGLLGAHGWLPVLAWLGADRLGKGIRTGPRDALISLSAPPGRLTEAFGLHRAFDTGGALLGPLLAVALLGVAPGSYSTVFTAAFLLAVVGLAVLVLFVENRRPMDDALPPVGAPPEVVGALPEVMAASAGGAPRRLWTPLAALWADRALRRLLAATALLSLPAVSDSLLFLALRHQAGMDARLFPSLFVVESLCYLLFAVPMGRLADRVGAGRVLLGGQVALACCFAVLLARPGHGVSVLALPALLGIYFAATDGVIAALTSQTVPAAARTTGLALVGLVLAAARGLATFGFGAVWTRSGPGTALVDALALTLVSGTFAAVLLRPFRPGHHSSARPADAVPVSRLPAAEIPAAVVPAASAGARGRDDSLARGLRWPAGPRVAAFVVVVAVCLTSVIAVSVRDGRREAPAARASGAHRAAGAASPGATHPVPMTASLPALLVRPHLLVLDAAEGAGFGRVEAADVRDPTGPRAPTSLTCDRVDQRAGRGLCLTDDRASARAGAAVFDDRLRVLFRLPIAGLASRTRVAPDGRIGAATTFVAGDAYNIDTFSTRTLLIDLVSGRIVADLEDFAVTRGGRRLHAIDENFWGVTFAADSDTFYATLHTGDHYYLIRGHVRDRRAEILRDGVECPSLSPAGDRIAYKSRRSHGFAPATWRLHVLDLATGADRPLAETRNVDDQAAWTDNDHVSYAVANTGPGRPLADTWTVPADGTGRPRLLVPSAQSVVTVAPPASG